MRHSVIAVFVITCPLHAVTATAQTLQPKQCLPMAQMNAALKAQDQRTLIIGDRRAVNDAPERSSGVRVTSYANAVTSNADGTIGYELEGDLPRAQSSTKMCVAAKLTHIRLFDARKPGTQPGALLGGTFNDDVRDKEKRGTRPMLIADTVHPAPDGSEQLGLQMIVYGNIAGRSASIYARDAHGDPVFMVLMGNADYTPEALRRLGN